MRTVVQHSLRYATAIFSLVFALPIGAAGADSASILPPGVVIPIPHPMTMLLYSESVRAELGLRAEQVATFRPVADQASLSLWRMRDLPPGERNLAARPLVESLRTTLSATLAKRQLDRLDQLAVRAMGVQAVLEPQVAAALGLSNEQRQKMQAVLGSPTRDSQNTGGVRARMVQDALAILTDRQRRTLTELMGPPFDVSAVQAVACKVPEFEGVTAWINSPPLTLQQLRGKVVIVHFYAFGCINCIHNLPHYNDWRERFDRDKLAMIGIHRPETQEEHDMAKVRQKAVEAGMKYPIAVDNESRNWNAWANRVWPSVYLIDKNGFVRYWWYGELNWQARKGDRWMCDRIAELLAARD